MKEISDSEALEALSGKAVRRAQPCNTWCDHTVVYPVEVQRNPKAPPDIENRHFVSMGQWYPESKMEEAKEIEKKYANTNKKYMQMLKDTKKPTHRPHPGNLLNTTIIEYK